MGIFACIIVYRGSYHCMPAAMMYSGCVVQQLQQCLHYLNKKRLILMSLVGLDFDDALSFGLEGKVSP